MESCHLCLMLEFKAHRVGGGKRRWMGSEGRQEQDGPISMSRSPPRETETHVSSVSVLDGMGVLQRLGPVVM